MEIGFATSVVETVQKPATLARPWRRQTHTPNDRYDNIVVEKLSDYPHGYPRLAAYLNSDVNTRLYRRFGYLHSRLLLHRQDELSALERDLAALDARDERDDPYRLNSRWYDDDNNNDDDDEQPSEGQSQKRKHLLNEIHTKLKEYDELLIRERDLMAMEKPQLGNYRHLYNWIWETKPLCEEETSFMYHRDDFVILASAEEYGWLGSFMDVLLAVIPRRVMLFLFSSPAAP